MRVFLRTFRRHELRPSRARLPWVVSARAARASTSDRGAGVRRCRPQPLHPALKRRASTGSGGWGMPSTPARVEIPGVWFRCLGNGGRAQAWTRPHPRTSDRILLDAPRFRAGPRRIPRSLTVEMQCDRCARASRPARRTSSQDSSTVSPQRTASTRRNTSARHAWADSSWLPWRLSAAGASKSARSRAGRARTSSNSFFAAPVLKPSLGQLGGACQLV